LVANSPGLIAGSNVLHRLLVPRHPPIALSSLSHNKKLQRCSRPLCSSQNTGRTTDPINHHLPASTPHHQAKPPGSRGPPTSSMVRAGPSHTTTPTPTIPHKGRPGQPVRHVTQKNRTIPSPGHGPIPQDPTARLGPAPNITHVPHPNPTKHSGHRAVLARSVKLRT
jgi:hypothetical protein